MAAEQQGVARTSPVSLPGRLSGPLPFRVFDPLPRGESDRAVRGGRGTFGDRIFYALTCIFALSIIVLTGVLVFELFRGSWESDRALRSGISRRHHLGPVAQFSGPCRRSSAPSRNPSSPSLLAFRSASDRRSIWRSTPRIGSARRRRPGGNAAAAPPAPSSDLGTFRHGPRRAPVSRFGSKRISAGSRRFRDLPSTASAFWRPVSSWRS